MGTLTALSLLIGRHEEWMAVDACFPLCCARYCSAVCLVTAVCKYVYIYISFTVYRSGGTGDVDGTG